MAERSLRGSRLGALSMERDEHVVPSQRQITTYRCPNGHVIELPFSIEAEIPPTWECRCGSEELLEERLTLLRQSRGEKVTRKSA